MLPSLSNGKRPATSPGPLAACQRSIFSRYLGSTGTIAGFYVRAQTNTAGGTAGARGPGRLTAQEEVEFTLQVVEHLHRQLEAKAGETELRRGDSNQERFTGSAPLRVDLRIGPASESRDRRTHKLLTSFSPASSSCRFDICRLPGKRGFWKRQSGEWMIGTFNPAWRRRADQTPPPPRSRSQVK